MSRSRIVAGFDTEPVQRALELIPETLRPWIEGVRFVCGLDPVFAGVHRHRFVGESVAGPARSWAHICYPWALAKRALASTVVLPDGFDRTYPDPVATVVHELGHEIDRLSGFKVGVEPVTDYATVDRYEAFAEAFKLWRLPDYEHATAELGRDDRLKFEHLELATRT